MKRIFLMVILATALTSQAYAGFFSNQPSGSTKLKFGDSVTVYAKEGFVMDEVERAATFVYDSDSHLVVSWPAGVFRGAVGPNHKARGTLRVVKQGPTRSILDSIAQKPAVWARYLDNHSCADESELRAGLGMPQQTGNLLASTCTSLEKEVAEILPKVNTVGDPLGGGSERWKIVTSVFVFPTFDWYRIGGEAHYQEIMQKIKKVNNPEMRNNVEGLLKDLPPENEIIPSDPVSNRSRAFEREEVVNWLADTAFTDDLVVNQFKKV